MQALGLAGMATAYRELAAQNNSSDLSRDEWLGLMLDRETALRSDKRLTNRLAASKLRPASRTSTLPLIVVSTAATLCRLRKGHG